MTLKKRTTTPTLGLTTLLILAGACTPFDRLQAQGTQSAEPVRWEGQMAPGTTLEVQGFNGQIRAVAATGSQARVEARRSARRGDPSEVEIRVVEHAGGVTLCAIHPSARRAECQPGREVRQSIPNNHMQVVFTVEVPAGVHLSAHTSNGAITAEGVAGDVNARTSNGPIRVDGARYADVRTSNGPITLRTNGEATASTSNGAITAHVGRLEGDTPLRFTTSNGPINLTPPAGANVSLDARTSNGRIQSDFPVTVSGTMQRNRMTGTIGAGGRPLEVRTSNGSIRLRQGA